LDFSIVDEVCTGNAFPQCSKLAGRVVQLIATKGWSEANVQQSQRAVALENSRGFSGLSEPLNSPRKSGGLLCNSGR
jgi:hypothetical protein